MSIAIEFNNVSKLYRLGLVSSGTLSNDLKRWWQMNILGKEDPFMKVGSINDRSKAADSEYVWALKDIDFKVEQGNVVGIIGKNGAGKSTLLKLLSKVTGPTTGTIKAKGRIASLLEVGTGFHGELTGRENIYMNGTILGMAKKEIDEKLDEIVDFSGCARYIDTPVKRYSSGMMVRLGFAVAAHLDPEILVVDEVLAVGDAEFQKKAIGKMQDVSKGEGRTVLFVSHNMASIRALCKTGVLLEYGSVKYSGEINDVVDYYLESQCQAKERIIDNIEGKASYLQINEVTVNGENKNPIRLKHDNPVLKLHFSGELKQDVNMAVEFWLKDKNAVPLALYSPSHYSGTTPVIREGHFEINEEIHLPETMNQGEYFGDLYLTEPGKTIHLNMSNALQVEYEGFPMKTGLVFNYNNGSGLLFLR